MWTVHAKYTCYIRTHSVRPNDLIETAKPLNYAIKVMVVCVRLLFTFSVSAADRNTAAV